MTVPQVNSTASTIPTPAASSTSQVSIAPSDLSSQTSLNRTTGPCANGEFVNALCFDELNLAEYLQRWWGLNEGVCNSKNAKFAQCFYALETDYGPSDCGQINNDAACTQPIWKDFENVNDGIQKFYVAWNLWNTAGFFLDMWTAIGAAEASSQAGIGQIVALLDPPKKENVALDYVFEALSFGLSLYAEGSLIVKALIRSTAQTSGLGNRIFPAGTVDGEYQDWSLVAANVGKCTDAFRNSVAQGLPVIENNITAFIEWSQVSGLSGYRPPLHGLSENMTITLNTYAISEILASQGIVVSRAANTDVHALQTNGSQLNWDTGCGGGYDNVGVCDTFFWDGVDTYGLTDPDHFTRNFHDELVSLFSPTDSAPPLTTGKLLFSGAQHCYEVTGKNGGNMPLLDPTDQSQITCLSDVPVCTWDENGYGPFDNSCKNLPDSNAVLYGFGVSGCAGEEGSIFSIDVPRAYLGPGIYQDAKNISSLYADDFCDNFDF